MISLPHRTFVVAACVLTGLALWLRWPTFGFSLWNVDEAIHAAAARTILDGGVLYRDAIDQRTPLSYYAVAAVFAICGENNLWAVRCFIALLVAATGALLFLAGRALRHASAGATAGLLYVLLSSAVLFQGDANAANTEWFAAFFSSAAAAVFLAGGAGAGPIRCFTAGLLLGCAFLSKQPALLDLAAPLAALGYGAWRQLTPARAAAVLVAAGAAGWLAPVLLTAVALAAGGALGDAVFYTWTYNLSYYGPEIATADRIGAAVMPFRLIGSTQPWLLALWWIGAVYVLHRLLQRRPAPEEEAANPGLLFVCAWSTAALAGSASGGRDFDHYTIQFLAPFSLGAGLVVSRLLDWARTTHPRRLLRPAAILLLVLVAYQAISSAARTRTRTLPEDPSRRVSAYIRTHSNPDDRIFVWGFHPDIYLHADRRPASRFVYASFITGLVPWTNTAPDRDTAYAIVPGTLATLLHDLTARPPEFIVDCSAGPNRHWQKYPLEGQPALQDFVHKHYRLEEPHQFVPQGFRLFRKRRPGETDGSAQDAAVLPAAVAETLKLATLAAPLTPVRAIARHGASVGMIDGRLEYFAHAPSSLTYRVSAGAAFLRGGFGIRAGAYGPDNAGPTDGAEFIIRWRPAGGTEQILLRRLLRPREESGDRSLQSFRVALPAHRGGELELEIAPGANDNAASDWTYWSDLLLENSH